MKWQAETKFVKTFQRILVPKFAIVKLPTRSGTKLSRVEKSRNYSELLHTIMEAEL